MRDFLFDAGARGWIHNYAKNNFWRVARWYELDDLIQDGYVCFFKCRRRYPDIRERKHLMALVKVTFVNHVHDLSKKRTWSRCEKLILSTSSPDDGDREQDFFDRILGGAPAEQEFMAHMKTAPELVCRTVELLVSEEGRKRLAAKRIKNPDGQRESLNDTVCRLLRVDRLENNLIRTLDTHIRTV